MASNNEHHNLLQQSFKIEDFQLHAFRDLLTEKKIDINNSAKIIEKIQDLIKVALEIHAIIQRINCDLIKLNDIGNLISLQNEDLFEEMDEINDEILDKVKYNIYLIIDIQSLIIWLMMFLDKIPHLIVNLFNGNPGIRMATYEEFYKSLIRNNNEKIIELRNLFHAYNCIFQKIRKIRHKYVIHKSNKTLSVIVLNKSYFGTQLRTYERLLKKSIILDNSDLDLFIATFKKFLIDLNKYLCDNIDEIPFNA